MDARELHNTLVEQQAPGDALVKALVFQPGFGDVEGEEKFIALRVAYEDKEHIFPTVDEFLLDLVGAGYSSTLAEFIGVLNESRAVRSGKLQALQELLRK